MRRRDHNILANAASLLLCGVLAGIVVAAAAFPAVALGGLAAKAGADSFGTLPNELNMPAPPQITYVYASDGKTLLATFYDENRHDIPLAQIPKVMQNAIIAAEDERFYDHNGVDLQSIARAFVSNQQGGARQGASTLTQQDVRQVTTYSATSPAEVIAATEQTNLRKIREARLALALETVLTKEQVLENYLNIAAFGHGAYGIYAASQVYFNKEPKDLKLEEAALLAGLPKAPSENDPVTTDGRQRALERRGYVLDQMAELGMVTRAEADAAKATDLKVIGNRTPNGCVATGVPHWAFFCDYFYRWWVSQKEFGRDEAERAGRLKAGGYRITSSLDVRIQDAAKRNVEKELPTGNSDALMLAAIEPGSGFVRAMAANRNYGLDTSGNNVSTDPAKRAKGIKGTYPTTTNPIISGGGDISGYKAGSTFKMFTMLAALERGFPLDFTIVARSPYKSPVYPAGATDIAACPDKVSWCPRNASNSMNGPRNMWTGFGLSVNTFFIPLQEKVGAENAIEMAKRLGIQFRSSKDAEITSDTRKSHLFGPFTIGVTDMVPLELANAYATVAADGKYCEPMPAIEILNKKGEKLRGVTDPRCRQAVKPEVARAALDAARCPIRDPGGLGKCGNAATTGTYFQGGSVAQSVNHPVFGKTGTADFNWTANLVISTKQLAIAATLANPDYAQTPHNDEAPRRANRAAVHTMREALANTQKIDFPKPPNELIAGTKVGIPNMTCKSVSGAQSTLKGLGFEVAIEPEKIDSTCPDNTVARTDPQGSTSKGSVITIYVSNGKPPAGPPAPGTGTGTGTGTGPGRGGAGGGGPGPG
jgi:membrane peptidoglycan carboxypeptidase